jgi:hypothetical protein
MSPAHASIGKVVVITINMMAVAFFALDPSVKVAYISLAGVFLTNITALVMFYLKLTRVEEKVDGTATALRENFDKKSDQLTETKGQLAHAEGHREGSDEERARDKP